MRENESTNHCGRSSRYIIRSPDTSSTCSFAARLFPASCTNTAWRSALPMQTWSRNGRNPATKISAAWDASKHETPTSERIASAESPSPSLRRAKSWSAFIVDAEAVRDEGGFNAKQFESSLLDLKLSESFFYFINYTFFGNKIHTLR